MAASYGNVYGKEKLYNALSNVTVMRTTSTSKYLFTFTDQLATANFGSRAVTLNLYQ